MLRQNLLYWSEIGITSFGQCLRLTFVTSPQFGLDLGVEKKKSNYRVETLTFLRHKKCLNSSRVPFKVKFRF